MTAHLPRPAPGPTDRAGRPAPFEDDAAPRPGRVARGPGLVRSVSTAYTAAHGHPAEHDTLVERESERRRWALGLRAALVAVVVLLLVAGVVVVRDLRAVSADPVPLAEVGAAGPEASGAGPDAQGGDDQDGDDGATSGATGEREGVAAREDAEERAAPRGRDVSSGSATLLVHVVGQVNAPGVVEVPDGSRVVDAILAAGGLTSTADSASVNLARPAVDGEQVYVPAPGEQVPVAEAVPAGPGTSGGAQGAAGLVDLNTAGADALQTLPGVGPALAQRILDWRATHGAFDTVDHLQDVSGIGPVVMERLRELVTVGR